MLSSPWCSGQKPNTSSGLAARLAELYLQFAAFGVQEYPHALWNDVRAMRRHFGLQRSGPSPSGPGARAVSTGTFLVDRSMAFSTSLVLWLTWAHRSPTPLTISPSMERSDQPHRRLLHVRMSCPWGEAG